MTTIIHRPPPGTPLLDRVKRITSDLEDYWFERKHGLDLGGIIPLSDLTTEHRDALPHANQYQATWCSTVRRLMGEAAKTGIAFENFIDIGSGKGKACFYAATRPPFRKIIGVEFSKELVDIANRNLMKFRSDNIEFIEADASRFRLPEANNLVFLFNSFDGHLLSVFIETNLAHFQAFDTLIAYSNDLQKETLTRHGFSTLFRDQKKKMSLFQYPRVQAAAGA